MPARCMASRCACDTVATCPHRQAPTPSQKGGTHRFLRSGSSSRVLRATSSLIRSKDARQEGAQHTSGCGMQVHRAHAVAGATGLSSSSSTDDNLLRDEWITLIYARSGRAGRSLRACTSFHHAPLNAAQWYHLYATASIRGMTVRALSLMRKFSSGANITCCAQRVGFACAWQVKQRCPAVAFDLTCTATAGCRRGNTGER